MTGMQYNKMFCGLMDAGVPPEQATALLNAVEYAQDQEGFEQRYGTSAVLGLEQFVQTAGD